MLQILSKLINFQIVIQGLYMTFLERIERNIKREFPDITPEELHERMNLIRHLIAMKHQKTNFNRKESIQ
jgi:hypothetical protein